jgi:hypothetical protein
MFGCLLRFATSKIRSSEELSATLFVAAAVFHSQYLIHSPGHIYSTPQDAHELSSAFLKTAHIFTTPLFEKSPCTQMIPEMSLNCCYMRLSARIYHPLLPNENFVPLLRIQRCSRVMHVPSFLLFDNHSLPVRDFIAKESSVFELDCEK